MHCNILERTERGEIHLNHIECNQTLQSLEKHIQNSNSFISGLSNLIMEATYYNKLLLLLQTAFEKTCTLLETNKFAAVVLITKKVIRE